jgi:hypothetical protein
MDTKTKGDIAEMEVQLKALKMGWEVLLPIGDKLPYDLVIVINGFFIKIQVKSAWFSKKDDVYLVDVRRTKTNRRIMKREKYTSNDFDFAIIFVSDLNVFYVIPVNVFNSYAGAITIQENVSKQRRSKSYEYREAWDLLEKYILRDRLELASSGGS